MKHTVAKTFKTIFIVLAVILLVLTVFLYYIDAPVIEEGKDPTVAQKIILLGKKYLGEILAICGVSALGLIGVLVKLIYNAGKDTQIASQHTSADVSALSERLNASEALIAKLTLYIEQLSKKEDIANNTLLTTFSLSELPVSLRETIHAAITEYNGLTSPTPKTQEEPAEDLAAAEETDEIPEKEEKDGAEDESKPSQPVYI